MLPGRTDAERLCDHQPVTARCIHLLSPPLCLSGHARPDMLPAACTTCRHYIGPPRGLGDVVKSIADATGISAAVERISDDCGCQGRREKLNAVLPFGRVDHPAS